MKTQKAVNNAVYRTRGHAWWDEQEGDFASLRFWVNPVRFVYFTRVIERERGSGRVLETVLDVGCGGGYLAEEFAKAGFAVTGVDAAPESIMCARRHAAETGLQIEYLEGRAERIPLDNEAFDVVLCCDVLEHVDDFERALAEIARVMKPNGLFFYDTVNRTLISKVAVIKVAQEWRSTAFVAPGSHVWSRFIKPRELAAAMARQGLINREVRGIAPGANAIAYWLGLRRLAQGKMSCRELGSRLPLRETRGLSVSYMGYATKVPRDPAACPARKMTT